jgi:hypothetical protein
MMMTTNNLDVYSINDAEDSDPDPIYEGDMAGLIALMGNVSLDHLFHDDDMNHDVFNVLDADGVVVAVAYA